MYARHFHQFCMFLITGIYSSYNMLRKPVGSKHHIEGRNLLLAAKALQLANPWSYWLESKWELCLYSCNTWSTYEVIWSIYAI